MQIALMLSPLSAGRIQRIAHRMNLHNVRLHHLDILDPQARVDRAAELLDRASRSLPKAFGTQEALFERVYDRSKGAANIASYLHHRNSVWRCGSARYPVRW
jgi:hypothetical protein